MLTVAKRDGVDVVYGVRNDRSTDTWFKRVSAHGFYRVIGMLSQTGAQANAGDFRLMSRATVDAINSLPEHNRVLRFIVPALNFPSRTVEYRREERAAGSSKYPLMKMIRLSVDSLTGFSTAPLRMATFAGVGGAVLAFLILVYGLIARAQGEAVAGWTSTVAIVAGVGRGAARLPRDPRGVHRPDVCPPAGAPHLLHRLRLARGRWPVARTDRHTAAGAAPRRGRWSVALDRHPSSPQARGRARTKRLTPGSRCTGR